MIPTSPTALVILIVMLGIYFVWKLTGPGPRSNRGPRRFEIGRHRKRREPEEDDDENDLT